MSLFKNSKIKNSKILSLSFFLSSLVIIFFSYNYSSASTNNSSQTAVVYGPSMNTTLKTGLVGWWTFDGADVTATQALDKSGNNHNGTRNTTTVAVGKIGQAIKFAGVNNNIAIANVPVNITATGYNTVSFWMKWDGEFLKMPFADVALGYDFYLNGGACIGFNTFQSDTYGISSGAVITRLKNRWAHVGLLFYNGVYTDKNKIYIDGVEQTLTQCGGTAKSGSLSQSISIGNNGQGGNNFGGLMDDVRIYNRALSAIEITALYKFGQNKMASSQTAKPTTGNTLKTGLVGWWTFDGADVTLTTTTDKSGNGNNGTRINNPLAVAGAIGQALSFNGSNQRVYGTISASTTADVTETGWIKTSFAQTGQARIIEMAPVTGVGLELCMSAAGVILVEGDVNAGVTSNIIDTVTVNNNKWHFIAVSRRGTVYTLYVDNRLVGTSGGTVVSYSKLSVGERATDGLNPFKGYIDEVRVYNRALSATELTALYKLGQEKMDSSQTAVPTTGNNLKNGLVGWWTFDGQDVNATQALDKSGQGNNVTRAGVTPVIGKIGQAMKFNGSTTWLMASAVNILNINTTTISVWVKSTLSSQPGYLRILEKNYLDSYYLGFTVGGTKFMAIFASSSAAGVSSQTTMAKNKWYHVLAIHDGANDYLYINGVLEDTKPNTVTLNNPNLTFNIGRSSSGGSAFTGLIDDVRIYNRALSASEVQELYKMGR